MRSYAETVNFEFDIQQKSQFDYAINSFYHLISFILLSRHIYSTVISQPRPDREGWSHATQEGRQCCPARQDGEVSP